MTLLTAVAAVLPCGTLASYLGGPLALAGIFGGAALVAGLSLRSFVSRGTIRPKVAEFSLATVDAIMAPALFFFLLVSAYAVARLSVWLLSFVGIPSFRPSILLIGVTVVGVPLAILAVAVAADSMKGKLYPDVAGVPSAYYECASRRGRVALTVLFGLMVPAGALAFLLANEVARWDWPVIPLLFYMFVVSAIASPPDPALLQGASREAVDALAASFEASGYEVVKHPRTGEAEVDPLLVEVDLFAQKGGRRFAMQVRQGDGAPGGSTAEPLTWTAATGVATAARVLELDLRASQPAQSDRANVPSALDPVKPVLVLVDLEPDSSLNAYSRAEGVPILSVGTVALSASVINGGAAGDLREIADHYVALLAGESSAEVSPAKAAAE